MPESNAGLASYCVGSVLQCRSLEVEFDLEEIFLDPLASSFECLLGFPLFCCSLRHSSVHKTDSNAFFSFSSSRRLLHHHLLVACLHLIWWIYETSCVHFHFRCRVSIHMES